MPECLDFPSESIVFLHSEIQLITHNHSASKGKKVDYFIKILPEIIPSDCTVIGLQPAISQDSYVQAQSKKRSYIVWLEGDMRHFIIYIYFSLVHLLYNLKFPPFYNSLS